MTLPLFIMGNKIQEKWDAFKNKFIVERERDGGNFERGKTGKLCILMY